MALQLSVSLPPGQFVDPKTGILSDQGSAVIQALITRTGGGTGGDLAAVRAIAVAAAVAAANSLQPNTNISVTAVFVAGLKVLGARIVGWVSPTAAGSRAAIDPNWTTTVSNPPTQAEMVSMRNQLISVQKGLAQLIIDAETQGWIGA